MNQSSFVISALREAVQGFVVGSLAWVFTCSLAGAIATAAGTEDLRDIDWVWAFAWIGHLLVAAAGLWGLIVLCIHAGCLGALIHGTEQVLSVLLIAFIFQLTTSVMVIQYGGSRIVPQTVAHTSIIWTGSDAVRQVL